MRLDPGSVALKKGHKITIKKLIWNERKLKAHICGLQSTNRAHYFKAIS